MAIGFAIEFLKSVNWNRNITSFLQCVTKICKPTHFGFQLFKGTIFNRQQADFKGVIGNKLHLLGPPQSPRQGQL